MRHRATSSSPRLVASARARNLVGVDTDARAVAECQRLLGRRHAVEVADAFAADLPDDTFDVVDRQPSVPHEAPSSDGGRRTAPGSAIGAARRRAARRTSTKRRLFLVLAPRLARPDGGRVAFVQPMATLATRDGGWARSQVLERAALEQLWMSTVFGVRGRCADVRAGAAPGRRSRRRGPNPRRGVRAAGADDPARGATWSPLLADAFGVPALDLTIDRCVGDIASVTADFRDEFYEIASLVEEGADGAQVVTTGLIDPGRSRWGEVPATIAGRKLMRPDCRRARALGSAAGSPRAEGRRRDANAGDRSRRRRDRRVAPRHAGHLRGRRTEPAVADRRGAELASPLGLGGDATSRRRALVDRTQAERAGGAGAAASRSLLDVGPGRRRVARPATSCGRHS